MWVELPQIHILSEYFWIYSISKKLKPKSNLKLFLIGYKQAAFGSELQVSKHISIRKYIYQCS